MRKREKGKNGPAVTKTTISHSNFFFTLLLFHLDHSSIYKCACDIWLDFFFVWLWTFWKFFLRKKILLIRKTGVDGRNSHFWFSWCCLYPPWTNYASSDDDGGGGSNIESIKINGKWWWWSLILKPLFSRYFSIA